MGEIEDPTKVIVYTVQTVYFFKNIYILYSPLRA